MDKAANYIYKVQVETISNDIDVINRDTQSELSHRRINIKGNTAFVYEFIGIHEYPVAYRSEHVLVLYQKGGRASRQYLKPSFKVYYLTGILYMLRYEVDFMPKFKRKALDTAISLIDSAAS